MKIKTVSNEILKKLTLLIALIISITIATTVVVAVIGIPLSSGNIIVTLTTG